MFLLVFGIEMAGFFDWVSGKFDACKCLKTVYPKGPAPDSQLCSVPLADRVPDARRSRAGAVHGQVPLPRDLLHRHGGAGARALLDRRHRGALPRAAGITAASLTCACLAQDGGIGAGNWICTLVLTASGVCFLLAEVPRTSSLRSPRSRPPARPPRVFSVPSSLRVSLTGGAGCCAVHEGGCADGDRARLR